MTDERTDVREGRSDISIVALSRGYVQDVFFDIYIYGRFLYL